MKEDEEFDLLLDEIPHETSRNLSHHHMMHHSNDDHHVNVNVNANANATVHGMGMSMMYGGVYDDESLRHCISHTCASPVSGFSLRSDGSSSSLFSNGHSFSDNGSPTPPPLEEIKYPNHKPSFDFPLRRNDTDCLIDEFSLPRNLGKIYLGNQHKDFSSDHNGLRFGDCFYSVSNGMNVERYRANGNIKKGFSDYLGFLSPVSRTEMGFDSEMNSALLGWEQEYKMDSLLGSCSFSGQSDALFPQQDLNWTNGSISSPWEKIKEQTGNYYHRGSPVSGLCDSLSRLSMADAALFSAQRNGTNWNEGRTALNFPNVPQVNHPRPHSSVENLIYCGMPQSVERIRAPSNIMIPQQGSRGDFTSEDSFIIQGNDLNYVMNKGLDQLRAQNKSSFHEVGVARHPERGSQLSSLPQIGGISGNAQIAKFCYPYSMPSKYNCLAEAQGYIYLIAKDQHGCRFLQRVFDEGTVQDVQMVFNEIIDHVVELMMNPFGNYLMQKLLEVCNEEQRMQILLMLTEEPGELVRISLNTHGTRVVQKLIETLKTRQQTLLVISALEPGFLALIKDLNGNHVVQRCLQCFANEDNRFIFVAAAKYCVDIATHQHGCCVLQRCISHSTGEYRENLVAEISANGLLLAQDAFGNYVVQFILELKIPSATRRLISQFEGNFVHLSTQKFSSHVVEKCLLVFNEENRSRIICELLSASHFEQLLQDPHANYVIQTALRVSEGCLHNSLVEAIESHKAISRTSPYSKRIFSQKLLKK